MFIQCLDCDYKYIINSAELKPNGRMVECANCNHRWFQELSKEDDLLSSSVPKTSQEKPYEKENERHSDEINLSSKEIKNLPSTVVREQKVSYVNTFLVIFFLVLIFVLFWTLRSYGTNIFVLVNFYLSEFVFNLKLIIDDLKFIIDDLAKIVYQIIN